MGPNRKSTVAVARRKLALVTGAARGIGRATAVALARRGFDVVVTSTRRGGTRAVAADIRAEGGTPYEVTHDVASRRDADRLARLIARRGALDVIVHNAAVVVRRNLSAMTDAEIDRVLDVNLRGPFYLTRRLLPPMLRARQGRVIFVSSISATLGSPQLTAYCASKWGLDGFMRALAEETRGSGLLVASVLPGSVDTEMLRGSPFRPEMTAAEVASVISYMACEAPLAMHGARVEVFGAARR